MGSQRPAVKETQINLKENASLDRICLRGSFDNLPPHQNTGCMHFARVALVFVMAAIAVIPLKAAEDAFDPPALYLQWQRDPTTTMTVHWHTVGEAQTELYFRKSGETDWRNTSGSARPLVGSDRVVHAVEIVGLSPATDYEFCFKPGERVFKFRTMPRDLNQPVRFITGGDVFHERKWMDSMNALAGSIAAEEKSARLRFDGCPGTRPQKTPCVQMSP